jgi:hypothetical protein
MCKGPTSPEGRRKLLERAAATRARRLAFQRAQKRIRLGLAPVDEAAAGPGAAPDDEAARIDGLHEAGLITDRTRDELRLERAGPVSPFWPPRGDHSVGDPKTPHSQPSHPQDDRSTGPASHQSPEESGDEEQ